MGIIEIAKKVLPTSHLNIKNVKEAAGYMGLVGLGATALLLRAEKPKGKYVGVSIGTFLVCAGIYLYLDYRENDKECKLIDRRGQQYDDERRADRMLYEAREEADARLHDAKNKSDLEKYRQMKAVELEYAKEIAKLKQSASNDNNGIAQPDPNWIEPNNYEKMRAGTESRASLIVPGYITIGLINVIVGGAGVAKSILMRQLALAIDAGGRIGILPDSNAPKMNVLFYRLEEFTGEEEGKYGRGDIFVNSGIMWRTKSDIEDFTLQGIIEDLRQVSFHIEKDTVIFLDPITKLSDFNVEKFIGGAEQAMNIAKERGHTLTLIVSAHLEELEPWKPTTSANIKGGDVLIQKAGSVMAICRERTGMEYRFLQCLKAPKGYPEPSDVVVCKIEKQEIDEHNWNTRMSYVCKKKEEEALPLRPKAASDNNARDILPYPKSKEDEMLNKALRAEKMKKEEELTDEELANKLGVSRQTISNWRKYLGEWHKNHPDIIEGVE